MKQKQALGLESKLKGLGYHAWVEESGDGRRVFYGVHVSCETEKLAGDYYGEFNGGYPWIVPGLEAIAKKRRAHWEWDSPGSISIWD